MVTFYRRRSRPPLPQFSPEQFSGLQSWHRAGEGYVTTDGYQLTTWEDLSGNGHDLSANGALEYAIALQHTYKRRPGVLITPFTCLTGAWMPAHNNDPRTVLWVFNGPHYAQNTDGTNRLLQLGDLNPNEISFVRETPGQIGTILHHASVYITTFDTSTAVSTDGKPDAFGFSYTGSVARSVLNGDSGTEITYTHDTQSANRVTLGREFSSGAEQVTYSCHTVFELLTYNTALSLAELQDATRMLRDQWR